MVQISLIDKPKTETNPCRRSVRARLATKMFEEVLRKGNLHMLMMVMRLTRNAILLCSTLIARYPENNVIVNATNLGPLRDLL